MNVSLFYSAVRCPSCSAAQGIYLLTPYPVAPELEQLEISMVMRPTGMRRRSAIRSGHRPGRSGCAGAAALCLRGLPPADRSERLFDGTVRYEISVLYGEQPLHFVLGEDSFVYESGPWYHRLRDAQPLIDALDRDIAANGTRHKTSPGSVNRGFIPAILPG